MWSSYLSAHVVWTSASAGTMASERKKGFKWPVHDSLTFYQICYASINVDDDDVKLRL